jgi:hypothetical protein
MSEESRGYPRQEVSIPCSLTWREHSVEALTENISREGALVTQLKTLPPPKGALVTLKFQRKYLLEMISSVNASVVRSSQDSAEGQLAGECALLFEDQTKEVRTKLHWVLTTLSGGASY